MEHIEVFLIGLFLAVAGLSTLARRLSIPYPILLVIGGLVLAWSRACPRSSSSRTSSW